MRIKTSVKSIAAAHKMKCIDKVVRRKGAEKLKGKVPKSITKLT